MMLLVAIALMAGLAVAADVKGTWSEENEGGQAQPQQVSLDYGQFYSTPPEGQEEGAAPEQGTEQFSLAGHQPTTLYMGGPGQKGVGFSQLQSYSSYTGGNSLWIQGSNSWAQYAQVPQWSQLSLVAMTPGGGYGYLYEIYPSGKLDRSYNYFYPTALIHFIADEIGQHVLLFTANNFASNAIIIDVQKQRHGWGPGPGPGPSPDMGMSTINIISSSMVGYTVYVDGVKQFTEGTDGVPDGRSSLTVTGNANHKLEIRKGGYRYSQTRYFQAGVSYTLVLS
jgi:hypothetical protein